MLIMVFTAVKAKVLEDDLAMVAGVQYRRYKINVLAYYKVCNFRTKNQQITVSIKQNLAAYILLIFKVLQKMYSRDNNRFKIIVTELNVIRVMHMRVFYCFFGYVLDGCCVDMHIAVYFSERCL